MFLLLFGGGLATIIYVAPKYNISMNFLTIFITIFELTIYLLTALKNPGIIIKQNFKEDLENDNKKL